MSALSTILLVGDNATTNYLDKLLTRMGVTEPALRTVVHACAEPAAAGCPALILLDMNMSIH